jgi:hypothetical protein
MLTVEFRDEDVDRVSEGSLVLEVGTQCSATTNEMKIENMKFWEYSYVQQFKKG